MTELTMRVRTARGYEETVGLVRASLGEAGFGVLTEIDIQATLKTKLDVDVEPQVILGACRPQHRAFTTSAGSALTAWSYGQP